MSLVDYGSSSDDDGGGGGGAADLGVEMPTSGLVARTRVAAAPNVVPRVRNSVRFLPTCDSNEYPVPIRIPLICSVSG